MFHQYSCAGDGVGRYGAAGGIYIYHGKRNGGRSDAGEQYAYHWRRRSGSFASIEYTVPGDYVYRVYQIAGKTEGMTYDTSTYQVTVRVVNTETGGLTAEIWAVKNDSDQKVDSINFDNQYDNGQEPAAPADPGNGNGSGNTGGNSGNDGSGGNGSSGSGSSGNNSSGSSSSRGAKTGDNSQIFLYSGLMAASLLCCGLFVLAGRRERRKSA